MAVVDVGLAIDAGITRQTLALVIRQSVKAFAAMLARVRAALVDLILTSATNHTQNLAYNAFRKKHSKQTFCH
jgi:hypothetical protein